ncbi:uncharacterized protein [Palaemon carinicauda]|uniref:uncharacterized protein n=1 Tax=Palaemon carinicauda TaxID=392227 RepID=UPI0035B5BFE1
MAYSTRPKAKYGNKSDVNENVYSDAESNVNNTEEEEDGDCGKCSKPVKDNQQGLQCELCRKWYYCGCGKISKDEYKSICEMKGKVMWFCISCKGKYRNVNKTNEKLRRENEVLKEIVDKLTDRLERIEEKLDRQTNFDAVQLEEKIEEHINEHFEREKKKTNVIIFGVEEFVSEDGYERKRHDNKYCEDLFEVLELPEERRKIDMAYRLGRYSQREERDEDYNRDVRIKLDIMGILENLPDSPIILLGDFNGHLEFIGQQSLDRTGSIVLDIAEKHNMVILNGDPLCEGEVTWKRRRIYEEEMRNTDSQDLRIELGPDNMSMIPKIIREHADAVATVIPGNITSMKKVEIAVIDIKQQIQKLKDGKAPGPDGIKPEIFKTMKDSEICINELKKAYKYILETEILEYTEEELKTFQKIGNRVYRAILELPTYTASSTLRSEIGASSAKARDIKHKILLVKHPLDRQSNELLREILLHQFDQETKFTKKIKKYMQILDVNLSEIENSSIAKLKEKERNVDTKMWKSEMEEKETLRIYKHYKKEIEEVNWFNNTLKTKLLIKARADTLDLNCRGRYKNKDTKCMCGHEEET